MRWHLDDVPPRAQGQLLDVDAQAYVDAVARSEHSEEAGKCRLREFVEEYAESHGKQGKTPRAHVRRPVRLACQNVIIGEAVWAHDARFDGLSVEVWQTSQEPHLNAHEGTRALCAMMLAEAFRSGGTMEVRFDWHPEGRVPATLAQWARNRGILLPAEGKSIRPAAARELMLAATDLPRELRSRIEGLAARGGLSVERACYTLLAGIWRPIELDFLLATSTRALDILHGGSDPLNRPRHQAEMDVCRAASMLSTLLACLERAPDPGVVVEDDRLRVGWTVLGDEAAVRFTGLQGMPPWMVDPPETTRGALTVLPRAVPDAEDCAMARSLAQREQLVAILTSQDVERLPDPDIAHMRHPDRRSALDRRIADRLLQSRVGRR